MTNSNTSSESIPVSSIMISNVKIAEENQSIQGVCKILYENKIGSIVIVKNSSTSEKNKESKKIPVGIVTERDIVRLVSSSDKLSVDQPVHLLMKTPSDRDIFRVIVKNQRLASGGIGDQILIDQQSIYGKFTDYWLKGVPNTP